MSNKIKNPKKLPPHFLLRLINKAKQELKKNEVMKRVCKEYGQDIDIIDIIPTTFADLDVSAQTNHGIVYLNFKLLKDGDFSKDFGYLVHEYSHVMQQYFNDKPTKGSDDGDYLDNPYEEEAFQNQIEYMAEEFGDKEAEKYVDHLIEYHDVAKKEIKDKKETLMAKV